MEWVPTRMDFYFDLQIGQTVIQPLFHVPLTNPTLLPPCRQLVREGQEEEDHRNRPYALPEDRAEAIPQRIQGGTGGQAPQGCRLSTSNRRL